jgi:hypothetical protein
VTSRLDQLHTDAARDATSPVPVDAEADMLRGLHERLDALLHAARRPTTTIPPPPDEDDDSDGE